MSGDAFIVQVLAVEPRPGTVHLLHAVTLSGELVRVACEPQMAADIAERLAAEGQPCYATVERWQIVSPPGRGDAAMTTATAPAPPTEAEIRAAIAAAWVTPPPVGPSPSAEWRQADLWGHATWLADWLYDLSNIRPSELERLDALVREAVAPVKAATATMLRDAVAGAVLAFAAEFPDAPRAVR